MLKQDAEMKHKYLIILLFLFIGINTIYAQAPAVTSISPASGTVGTPVIIEGSGFSAIADSNAVYFGATPARVTAATATRLAVIVPAGATFKPVTISNKLSRLVGHSAMPFSTTFSPAGDGLDAKVRFAADTGASDVMIGDIDGDGKADIVAINPTLQILMIFRNTSTAGTIDSKSFAPPLIYPTGVQAALLAVDDLDGDGRPDILLINGSYAYSHNGSNTLTLYRNASTRGHIKLSGLPVTVGSPMPAASNFLKLTSGTSCVKVADFDGDGKPDLAVLNSAGFVSVYRNIYNAGQPGGAVLAAPLIFNVGTGASSISVGDLDGDGKPDMISSSYSGGSMTVLYNTSVPGTISASSFVRTDFQLGYSPLTIDLADMDGDGKTDIIIGRPGNNRATLFHNTSTPGHFSGTEIRLANVNIAGNFKNHIVVQDMDGDGKPDLLSLSADLKNVYLYINKSTPGQSTAGYFNDKISYPITTIADAASDLDGDGRPDIIVASRFGIDVYRGKAAPVQAALVQPVTVQDSLIFHPALSPNGDGINDVFTIDNIRKFPQNTLTIISISGAKIYEASGYGSNGKNFDGHSNITGLMQKPGTYFYELQYTDNGIMKNKTGYLILRY